MNQSFFSESQNQLFATEIETGTKRSWHDEMLAALRVENGPGWPDRFGRAMREWLGKKKYEPIKTLSLFSGGGGLDIAFHDTGFDIIEMVEIDSRFAATLDKNAREGGELGSGKVNCIDIRDYSPPKNHKIDFIVGGPPCQTFSAAGRRAAGVKGTTDPRGVLFEEYVRLLLELKPKGFLFENVYGITGAQGGEPWRQIQQAFREAGYVIHWRVLDAADYGVPQHRERLFIVGVKEGEGSYLFPYPTHGSDSITPCPYYPAGEAVKGAPQRDEGSLAINGRWGHLIPGIPPGLNYSFYTKEMGHPSPIFAWRSKFSDFMYKADPDMPVRTIKAQGGLYTGPFSWENRHFSVGELKRLQTFPDDYEVVGKRQVQIHQIGNSVPPQIGRILALSIVHQLFKIELPFPMHYLLERQELGFRKRKRALTDRYALKAKHAIAQIGPTSRDPELSQPKADETLFLTDKFELLTEPRKGGLPVQLAYAESQRSISIEGSLLEGACARDAGFRFRIEIAPRMNGQWVIPLDRATLLGEGSSIRLATALWKAFERLAAARYGIDDLVQLSGYYQYTPQMVSSLEIESEGEPLPVEWIILNHVLAGNGIAKQLDLADLAELWGVSKNKVLPVLRVLRDAGYEVRSHNTNPQIAVGEFLIPYAFPTLTPRSVQLRKKI